MFGLPVVLCLDSVCQGQWSLCECCFSQLFMMLVAILYRVIVVATADFELYHDVVAELRARQLSFTTVDSNAALPPETTVLITGTDAKRLSVPDGVDTVSATPEAARSAVEEAVSMFRDDGRTIVGIDPGERPGVAVLVGDRIVATFQLPPDDVPAVVREETADASNPLVRVGDGARLIGARLIEELELPVELVDETGTTPYLGTGVRGVGDVLAAVNIARIEGDYIKAREIEPTDGELTRIKDRARKQSDTNRAIDATLAREVAVGNLTVEEALDQHRSSE
ncbi:MAG: hypothetical protein J07HX5_00185 [halophilic archaeon J07HX5]|nr:MAG: hypothetical protein J07HX5_00185 [halophilic archaeon J07HX5]